ncbi:DEAD/DEAH box helicase [Oceanispirochaeta crateris]|uniref:DEAD/DEAH box helicase n=1 Tax=Oceanispirochaeta crateris TaxID=2518645 RepID=A0A5C1QN70_9SPIO|nr:DEAD/DEAH box helicase [Oceanispirochaeta crateris]QEN08669.1 DEAD/DEAH box helicase [Oceanispirochaeta crateris]
MSDKISEKFTDFGLSPALLRAIKVQKYEDPSPVQIQTIPAVMSGQDVLAAAQTGTGKTAAYTLPILDRLTRGNEVRSNHVRALILTPTRELAAQVYDSVVNYSRFLPLRSTVVYGGVKINPQMIRLTRGVDILVATPGRLLDLYRQNAINFQQLEILILDEADRMLNLGFLSEVREIKALIPQKRQTLMFTATFSEDVRALAEEFVSQAVEITIDPEVITLDAVKQWIYPVDKMRKTALFIHLIQENHWEKILVFTKTKNGADHLARKLMKAGISTATIHGNKSQGARTRALDEFKSDKVSILVATDLAARGLDIDQLPLVVNFDLPHLKEDYIHRIGRTGRAGATGEALSFVCFDDFEKLADIERLTKQVLDRRTVEGFEPEKELPPSRLDLRPFKPKKPKKPKKKKQIESLTGN